MSDKDTSALQDIKNYLKELPTRRWQFDPDSFWQSVMVIMFFFFLPIISIYQALTGSSVMDVNTQILISCCGLFMGLWMLFECNSTCNN